MFHPLYWVQRIFDDTSVCILSSAPAHFGQSVEHFMQLFGMLLIILKVDRKEREKEENGKFIYISCAQVYSLFDLMVNYPLSI